MKAGTEVMLMGVHRSFYVACDDDGCPLLHYLPDTRKDGSPGSVPLQDGTSHGGRYHYEDGPREGVPAVYEGAEGDRAVLRLANGTVVTADAADVEVA